MGMADVAAVGDETMLDVEVMIVDGEDNEEEVVTVVV